VSSKISKADVRPDAAASEQQQLGHQLRALRHDRGLSLKQVAQACGISVSFLSLVESGGSDITFGRLRRLLRLYGVSPNDLVGDDPESEGVVVRAEEQPFLFSLDDGITGFLAVPDTTRMLLSARVDLEPGAAMVDLSSHNGEEFVIVIEGRLKLEFKDGASFTLRPGDTAHFDSRRPHKLSNIGRAPARAFSIVTTGVRGQSRLTGNGVPRGSDRRKGRHPGDRPARHHPRRR
jgi:transcriptional regulator with XRE-family HTH domain